jgi:hypothetical protein
MAEKANARVCVDITFPPHAPALSGDRRDPREHLGPQCHAAIHTASAATATGSTATGSTASATATEAVGSIHMLLRLIAGPGGGVPNSKIGLKSHCNVYHQDSRGSIHVNHINNWAPIISCGCCALFSKKT